MYIHISEKWLCDRLKSLYIQNSDTCIPKRLKISVHRDAADSSVILGKNLVRLYTSEMPAPLIEGATRHFRQYLCCMIMQLGERYCLQDPHTVVFHMHLEMSPLRKQSFVSSAIDSPKRPISTGINPGIPVHTACFFFFPSPPLPLPRVCTWLIHRYVLVNSLTFTPPWFKWIHPYLQSCHVLPILHLLLMAVKKNKRWYIFEWTTHCKLFHKVSVNTDCVHPPTPISAGWHESNYHHLNFSSCSSLQVFIKVYEAIRNSPPSKWLALLKRACYTLTSVNSHFINVGRHAEQCLV